METTEFIISNYTDKDVEDNVEDYFTTTPLWVLATLSTTMTILLILVLNPLMLFTLRRVSSIQPTTKVLMASLTLSDLGSGIVNLFILVELFAGSWLLGDFLCLPHSVLAY